MLSPSEYQYMLGRDLPAFIQRSFYELNPQTEFIDGAYIHAIAAKLEACRRGEIRRLAICLPPRCLKSHSASVAFTAWWLGHNPEAHIISASYGQDLSSKFARDSRTLMQSAWYRATFGTRLAGKAVDDLTTTAQGTRMATSVGGVLTGRGADLIIIDDPLKPGDAMSDTQRKAVNDWYDNSLISRLNDKEKGCIIIIMQRLHQDDLIGHVLGLEEWDVLSFPAIAEEDETHLIDGPYGRGLFTRKKGEALHPERDSLPTLERIRSTMTAYDFSAQYQQNPTPVGGAIIKTKWLRYYKSAQVPAGFSRIVQSWDTANKSTELADYSVCTTWGVLGKEYYLLDVFRERLEYPDLRRKVLELAKRFDADAIVIEDKASGTQLIQELKASRQLGIQEYVPPPQTDKIMRLHTQSIRFEGGQVLLPSHAPWLADYVKELTSFPGTKYDDQVDSTAQAMDYLRTRTALETWEILGRAAREGR